MANIISYIDVIELLKSISERHYQINTFFLGRDSQIGENEAITYPCLQVYPESSSMPINLNGEYKTIEIKLNCKILDLLHSNSENTQDVHSDTLRIAQDVVNEFNQHPFYQRSNANLVGDIELNNLESYNSDVTSGWEFAITLKLINNNNFCGLPIEDITGYSASGPVYTGYSTSVQYLTCETLTGCTSLVNYVQQQIESIPVQTQYWTSGATGIHSVNSVYVPDLFIDSTKTINSVLGGGQVNLNNSEVFISTDSGAYAAQQLYLSNGYVELSDYSVGGMVGVYGNYMMFVAGNTYSLAPFGLNSYVYINDANSTDGNIFLGIGDNYDTIKISAAQGLPSATENSNKPGTIISSRASYFDAGVTNSVILGGTGLQGTSSESVFVPYLNIKYLTGSTAVNNLGIDANGFVCAGTTAFTFTGGTVTGSTNFTSTLSALTLATPISSQSNSTSAHTINMGASNIISFSAISNCVLSFSDAVQGQYTIIVDNSAAYNVTLATGSGWYSNLAVQPNLTGLVYITATYNGSKMFIAEIENMQQI